MRPSQTTEDRNSVVKLTGLSGYTELNDVCQSQLRKATSKVRRRLLDKQFLKSFSVFYLGCHLCLTSAKSKQFYFMDITGRTFSIGEKRFSTEDLPRGMKRY